MSRGRCDCGDTECPSCGTAQGTRTPTNLQEKLERLIEIKEELGELLREAERLTRGTREEERAHAYWLAHMKIALDDEHGYINRGMCTMQNTLDALESELNSDEEDEE